MTQPIWDTGVLLRDVSWIVMSSLLALSALDVDGWEAQEAKRREELAWHTAITLNALNSRDMLVGGHILVQCRATPIEDLSAPALEPARSRLRAAAYDFGMHAQEGD